MIIQIIIQILMILDMIQSNLFWNFYNLIKKHFFIKYKIDYIIAINFILYEYTIMGICTSRSTKEIRKIRHQRDIDYQIIQSQIDEDYKLMFNHQFILNLQISCIDCGQDLSLPLYDDNNYITFKKEI